MRPHTLCTAAGAVAVVLLTAAQASAAVAPPAAPDLGPAPISDSELSAMRGGEATAPTPPVAMVLTDQTATNGYNTVSAAGNVSSGDVNLGQNAFQGFAGIGNFLLNTGHNNNLLGNLSVVISMLPTGAPNP